MRWAWDTQAPQCYSVEKGRGTPSEMLAVESHFEGFSLTLPHDTAQGLSSSFGNCNYEPGQSDEAGLRSQLMMRNYRSRRFGRTS